MNIDKNNHAYTKKKTKKISNLTQISNKYMTTNLRFEAVVSLNL